MDTSEPKLIAKIQRFYDVLSYKKIDAENIVMLTECFGDDKKCMMEKIQLLTDLMNEYDSIFKEFVYKDKQ
jgi:hypothetical protein